MKKHIIFCGGGSGGHVMPALTLIEALKEKDYVIEYIGGNGIESEIVPSKSIPYHQIQTGKLRRYLSVQNMIDIFKVGVGIIQAFFFMLGRPSNALVFSTGGFVSVPVIIAAWLTGKKIFIHEQTSRVGLANKIASKFADKVFISFDESKNYFPIAKTSLSGYPLRDECYRSEFGKIEIEGIEVSSSQKPVLFITGGGNGAKILNEKIRDNLNELTEKFLIVHQVGKQFVEEYSKLKNESYLPVAFVGTEMIDLFKKAEIVISRAGAGTVSELLSLNKKSIFIPLKIAQKNEQFHNAMEAHEKIGSLVIEEDEFINLSMKEILERFYGDLDQTKTYKMPNGKDILVEEINKAF
jgi:UDP-N-acetylglucosamine--N-acetylmuramyl-(pentapeptide) pyrophosphoryl-undecaprenol N-acetylglucosamine transferase